MPSARRAGLMLRSIPYVACLFVLAAICLRARGADQPPAKKPAAKPADPAFAAVVDDPKLPRVMILGDSISIGYTLPTRELLKGKANVHRPAANCADTATGLKNLDAWLGDGKWDVIHFNWGLHDLKYLDAHGKYVSPDAGKQVALPDQYEKNLRELVARLKKTGAKLVWASTTPVPDGSAGRVKGDEVKYNEAAARVMADNGIPTDDLHAVVEKDSKIQLPHNVHFTSDGYHELAESVAASVETALAAKNAK